MIQIPMFHRLQTLSLALLAVLTLVVSAVAGLNEIEPRPQQMGSLAASPVVLDGALALLMPDSPTESEGYVRDEIIAQLTSKMGIPPVEIPYSQWNGEGVALWVGTPARFPDLVDSLLAAQIPGLGELLHQEEYQLLVNETNVFLAGSDQLGLEWGLFSLLKLMGDVFGQTTIDRVYIRDWPDFPKRVCTVNSSVRAQPDYDYADSLSNWAYHCKMDEIEWNDSDGGHAVRSPFAVTHALMMRNKLKRRGQFLTFGTDQTALRVLDKSWQEGVPILGMPMTVGSTSFTTGSYGITVTNGGFETFTSGVPNGWTMEPTSGYSLISRDISQHHSGSSSLKWANMSSGYQWDRTVHQKIKFGSHRLMRLHFWYKTSNFSGRIRILILGDDPVNNHFVNGRNTVPSTGGWAEITGDFSVYNSDSATIWIGPEEYTSGTLWIDDISFENAGPMRMLRRADTPVAVYKQPGNNLMTENVDYTIVETDTGTYNDYVLVPRISRINGGALAVGNQVTVDWSTGILYQGGRETVCFSMLEPLEYYQQQIRNLDSTLAPDGYKIHMIEVTLANYDQNCLSRGLSPGQVVGGYVNQMYNIVQARIPGVPVRSYGDAFDIWVKDNRCQPVTTSPWNIGALQQVSTNVEMMVMTDYSNNMDSSFAYFNRNGHPAIMSYYGDNSFAKAVEGASVARRAANCTGFLIWDWNIAHFANLLEFSSLAWNFGPFFIHNPPRYTTRPDTVFLSAEMWSDSFLIEAPTSITSRSLTYRFLPGGNWTTITPAAGGTRTYRSSLVTPPNVTSVEYYFSATDHRGQVSKLPPDAPSRVFSSFLPASTPNDEFDPHHNRRALVPIISGQMIEWPDVEGVSGYEIHWSEPGDLTREEQTLIATVPAGQTKYFFDPKLYQNMSIDHLIVSPIWVGPLEPQKVKAKQ